MNIAWVVLGGGFVGILAKRLAWVDGPNAQPHLGFRQLSVACWSPSAGTVGSSEV